MSKHTPGPWRVGTPGPNGCYTVGTMQGLMTAMVAHSINMADQREQAEADARLIAAAPELLEALEGVMRMIKWAKENDDSPKSALSHFISSEPVFAVAIAKATGETK